LFVAEGFHGQIKGFALMYHDNDLQFCYVEFLSADKGIAGRGVGGALFSRAREEALALKTIGIFGGEICWADLNPTRGHEQAGMRPVLILSHDVFNERSGTVIAIAITSQPQKAGFPLTLELKTGELPKRSWVKISQIRTLSTERIGQLIGKVSPEELAQVVEGLNEIIA